MPLVSVHVSGDAMHELRELLDLYQGRGHRSYVGEPISQLQHALQAATRATAEGAAASLVVAALFHDVGHLLLEDESATRRGVDTRHEAMGARYLGRWFDAAVTEPVRLHVDAKRYLVRDPAYAAMLSEESLRSLALQGGVMSDAEAEHFRNAVGFEEAIRLRRWDDVAKIEGWRGPGLGAFHALIEEVRSKS